MTSVVAKKSNMNEMHEHESTNWIFWAAPGNNWLDADEIILKQSMNDVCMSVPRTDVHLGFNYLQKSEINIASKTLAVKVSTLMQTGWVLLKTIKSMQADSPNWLWKLW